VDEPEKQGFVDAVATAFLHRRLHSRRLRAAAVRGVKTVSAGTGSAGTRRRARGRSRPARRGVPGAPHVQGLPVRPYRYVDWSEPPPHRVVADLGELIGDAAHALQAGVAELLPSAKRRPEGVVFSDEDESASTGRDGPVRKLRRWLHLS